MKSVSPHYPKGTPRLRLILRLGLKMPVRLVALLRGGGGSGGGVPRGANTESGAPLRGGVCLEPGVGPGAGKGRLYAGSPPAPGRDEGRRDH